MNDILQVLEQQTSQTETLIARLQQRLEQTNQLRALELQRAQVIKTVGHLEQQLLSIDTELSNLQQLAASANETDLDASIAELQAVWNNALRFTTPDSNLPISAPLTGELFSEPVLEEDSELFSEPVLEEDSELFSEPVLEEGSGLFGELDKPDSDEGLSFGGGLFSAAEELQDTESPNEWAWWGDPAEQGGGNEEAPPPSLFGSDFLMTELDGHPAFEEAEMVTTLPQTPEQGGTAPRKGWLGRFF